MKNFGEIHKADALLRLQMWQERCKDVVLNVGDFIQTQIKDGNDGEHAWLEIEKIGSSSNKEFLCRIDNDLVLVKRFKFNDRIFVERDQIESHSRTILLGDIVVTRQPFLGEPTGTLAYVYETYPDFDDSRYTGVSLITENGVILGGFSKEEQYLYLKDPIYSRFEYTYKNDITLSVDFDSIIKPLFKI